VATTCSIRASTSDYKHLQVDTVGSMGTDRLRLAPRPPARRDQQIRSV